jgi:hypothetical protein
MNASHPPFDDRFDRLVDGELSPAEYRQLLASLDDMPDGWRQCALAFLEAQALSGALPAVVPPAAAKALPAVANTPPFETPEPKAAVEQTLLSAPAQPGHSRPADMPRWSQAVYFATIAASLALAFYLGSWTKPSDGPVDGIATRSSAIANRGSGDAPSSAGSTSIAQAPASLNSDTPRSSPLGNVRLVMNGAEEQGVDVPVYGEGQLDAWRTTNKPVLPDQVIEQLQAAGHKVSHQEQWIRVQLDGGREVLVPVDDYRIQPRLGPAY